MAKLRVYKSIENDLYVIDLVNDAGALSQTDKDLMKKFGEPEINLGGTFLESTLNEFTLPDKFVRVRSDFPQRVVLDSTAAPFDSNTLAKANGYVAAIEARFGSVFTALRTQTDTFSGEEITNI